MDLYQVLGITPAEVENDATIVKSAYKEALLKHHPDKRQEASSDPMVSKDQEPINYEVETIRKAFDILSNSSKREAYDNVLRSAGRIAPVAVTETVDLDDMDEHDEESSAKWTRACRCGEDEGYTVTEQDLVDNGSAEEISLQCVGCSLWIKVVYSVES